MSEDPSAPPEGMIIDHLNITYFDPRGSSAGNSAVIPHALASHRFAAGLAIGILMHAAGRPVARIEYLPPARMYRLFFYEDTGRRRNYEIECAWHDETRLKLKRGRRWCYTSEEDAEFDESRLIGEPFLPLIGEHLVPRPTEFGDWTTFALLLGRYRHPLAASVTVGERGPYPQPENRRGAELEQLFTPGMPHHDKDGHLAHAEVYQVGNLRLRSGRIDAAAADPYWCGHVPPPLTVTVDAGSHPVHISVLEGNVAAARITLTADQVLSWERATQPGRDPASDGEGQTSGFGSTGRVCLCDAEDASALLLRYQAVLEERTRKIVDDFPLVLAVEIVDRQTNGNLIEFCSNTSEQKHPIWIGRSADGSVACLIVDFELGSTASSEIPTDTTTRSRLSIGSMDVGAGTRLVTVVDTDDPTSPADVRMWARTNGYQVSARGRISADARRAYFAAHRRGDARP